ncbi:MAG: hypothetical protein QXF01_01525 [Candidatus Micrarchaeaceae archaeon]
MLAILTIREKRGEYSKLIKTLNKNTEPKDRLKLLVKACKTAKDICEAYSSFSMTTLISNETERAMWIEIYRNLCMSIKAFKPRPLSPSQHIRTIPLFEALKKL